MTKAHHMRINPMPQTAAGRFAGSLWDRLNGSWIDKAGQCAQNTVAATALAAGYATRANTPLLPMVLIEAFSLLFIFIRRHRNSIAMPFRCSEKSNTIGS